MERDDRMTYKWDSSLETGNKIIDGQHKQLIAALNNLLDACRDGKGQEELMTTVEFLNGYIIKHFSDEEKTMTKNKYPDYALHHRYHDEFKLLVHGITKQFQKDGPTDALVAKVHSSIADWLLNHIKGDDFKLAAYLVTMDGESAKTLEMQAEDLERHI
jgi:hemerythrin